MQNQINLVQGDTGPDLTVALYDSGSNAAIDVSNAGDVVRLYFRKEDQSGTPVVTTIVGDKTNGGTDGVMTFAWPSGALDSVGHYEAEIEISFSSGKKQTIPDKLRFYVRAQIQ